MSERDNSEFVPKATENTVVPSSNKIIVSHYTEFVDLPSEGIYYSGITSLSSGKVEIKFITSVEEDILSNMSFVKEGVMLDKLVASLLVDPEVSVENLLSADKTAIVIAARKTAFGDTFKGTMRCPACGEVHDIAVHLEDNVKQGIMAEGAESWDAKVENDSVMITLPKTKAEVRLKLMDTSCEREMFRKLMSKKKSVNKGKKEDTAVDLTDVESISTIVVAVNGVEDKSQINDFLKNMPTMDKTYMKHAYKDFNPFFDLFVEINCKCGYDFKTEVGVTADFFWPKI